MKAYGNSFSVIRNSYFYEIPFFQRRYVWKEENWKELLDSMSNPDGCPFLGSIILKENRTSDGVFFWTVIDGQQRLTTLSILMRACFDELFKLKDTQIFQSNDDYGNPFYEKVAGPFRNTTHIEDRDGNHIKIRHSHIDRKDFEKVMNGDIKDKISEIDLCNADGIIQCYCFFRNELRDKTDTVQVIWRYLTRHIDDHDENGKYLVIIELGEKENEQTIFDTINTAGVRLTSADTIKNKVFQQYIELLQKEGMSNEKAQNKATELYDEEWDGIFSDTHETERFWNKARQVGRLYRDNIELLLHCIAVIKGFFDPAKNKMSDLPECYKNYVSGLSKSVDTEKFIKEINTYARLYQEYFNDMTWLSYDTSLYIQRTIHISDVLEISTFYPYILYLIFLKKQGSDVEEQFLELEQYLVLHAICGETTKNYNNECIQFIKGAAIKEMLGSCKNINSDNFEYGLRHMSSNKLATLLLFWVELYKRSTENSDNKEFKYEFTLEHIMPQKWEQHWSDAPVYDENGEQVSDEEQIKAIRHSAIYEIGNMTLLNKKLNASVSNYDFKRKIEGEGKKRGMKELADCLIARELLEKKIWDEREIRKRTAELSKIIRKLWGSLLA